MWLGKKTLGTYELISNRPNCCAYILSLKDKINSSHKRQDLLHGLWCNTSAMLKLHAFCFACRDNVSVQNARAQSMRRLMPEVSATTLPLLTNLLSMSRTVNCWLFALAKSPPLIFTTAIEMYLLSVRPLCPHLCVHVRPFDLNGTILSCGNSHSCYCPAQSQCQYLPNKASVVQHNRPQFTPCAPAVEMLPEEGPGSRVKLLL